MSPPDSYIELWDAINAYAESYLGGVYGNVARQQAAVRIEAAVAVCVEDGAREQMAALAAEVREATARAERFRERAKDAGRTWANDEATRCERVDPSCTCPGCAEAEEGRRIRADVEPPAGGDR